MLAYPCCLSAAKLAKMGKYGNKLRISKYNVNCGSRLAPRESSLAEIRTMLASYRAISRKPLTFRTIELCNIRFD